MGVNDALMDDSIRHQIELAKFTNGVVRRLIAVLNRADADLFAALTAVLERMDPGSFSVDRLESLLGSVRAINAQAYGQMGAELRTELRDFVAYEAQYQGKALETALPVRLHVASVSVDQVYAAALSRPFQGALLNGFLTELEADKAKRVRMAVAQGFTEQKTVAQIVRDLRGTRARGFEDGIIEINRRNAEAVVRTAVSHMAGVTRDRFMEANKDIIKAVVWTATLDSRTSEICRLRDGKRYTADTHKPIGHKLPWLGGPGRAHWNCRSVSVPVTKSWKELTGFDIPEFTPSQRASMDGAVPADMTYGEWLQKQSAARQDDVLGPTRGKLLRDGGLTLDRFANDKGQWLTLDQLRERDAQAFKRAGV